MTKGRIRLFLRQNGHEGLIPACYSGERRVFKGLFDPVPVKNKFRNAKEIK
jgi:hypothetical protein